MAFIDCVDSVSRVIHPADSLAPVYSAQYSLDEYFRSAMRQVDALDGFSQKHLGQSLTEMTAIADFACHYGRLVRGLRVAAPEAKIFACDIDHDAMSFCQQEFGAHPFYTAWSDASGDVPQVDLLVCVSLITHTRKDFFEYALNLWGRMVRPGGLLVFTYLGDQFLQSWEGGEMSHYGAASYEERHRAAAEFRMHGHAFHGYLTPYSDTEYGVGFLSHETIKSCVAKSGKFVLLEMCPGPLNEFGQDVVVARRRNP